MFKVKFLPNDVEFEIQPNQSVLDLAHEHGVHIQSVCKGVPSCAECRVQIKRGEHNVIPPSPTELGLIGTAQFVDNSRLACQLRCFGNIEVDLTEQIEKEKRVLESRRPRGADSKKETSSAVSGNLILQEAGRYSDMAERDAAKHILNEEIQLAKKRLKELKTRPESAGVPSEGGPTANVSENDSADDLKDVRAAAPDSSSQGRGDQQNQNRGQNSGANQGQQRRDQPQGQNRNQNRNQNRSQNQGAKNQGQGQRQAQGSNQNRSNPNQNASQNQRGPQGQGNRNQNPNRQPQNNAQNKNPNKKDSSE